MKEIITRSLTGLFFIITIIGSIWISPWAFFGVMGVYGVIGLFELSRLLFRTNRLSFVMLGALAYALIGLWSMGELSQSMTYLILPLFFIPFVIILFDSNSGWHQLGGYFIGLVYLAVPFGLLSGINGHGVSEHQPLWIISTFVLVWTNDVFAYLSGTFFGKHRLYERVSPKKSWEGSIGGLILTLGAAALFYYFSNTMSVVWWLVFALILVVTATIGDLIESKLKREAGVKDSGHLFPGHGGVLDRMDAVLFAAPFAYFYLNFV